MSEEKKDVQELVVPEAPEVKPEGVEPQPKADPPKEDPSPSANVEEEVDELLHDGTKKDKEVTLDFERFSTLNEKAKQTDELKTQVEELTARLQGQGLSKDDIAKIVDERISPVTAPLKAQKDRETRQVLADAIQNLPDFKAKWSEIRPLVAGLESSGLPYKEAVKRAYIAINPQHAIKVAELEAANADSSRGYTSTTVQGKERSSNLTPEQQEEARRRGWSEAEYLRKTGDTMTFELPTKSAFVK